MSDIPKDTTKLTPDYIKDCANRLENGNPFPINNCPSCGQPKSTIVYGHGLDCCYDCGVAKMKRQAKQ